MKEKKPDRQTVAGHSDIAVALRYDGEGAPKVTAKGTDMTAERLIALAETHEVPLYPNPELATALVQIPLGEEVPEDLYRAVAEVISFAYLVAGKMPKGFTPDKE
ncbi:MAG: flagellar protein FhlB [Gammaproteobacteria bacterium]|nr:MAG: flagellar protein FhlB [Gammaproteobacteria bacterium]